VASPLTSTPETMQQLPPWQSCAGTVPPLPQQSAATAQGAFATAQQPSLAPPHTPVQHSSPRPQAACAGRQQIAGPVGAVAGAWQRSLASQQLAWPAVQGSPGAGQQTFGPATGLPPQIAKGKEKAKARQSTSEWQLP